MLTLIIGFFLVMVWVGLWGLFELFTDVIETYIPRFAIYLILSLIGIIALYYLDFNLF